MQNVFKDIYIERKWAMPNKNTFNIKPIKNLLELYVNKKYEFWVDPFANKSKLASVTNDLNPIYDTDYHMDALDFLKMFETQSVDGVLFDAPFSLRQLKECYDNVGVHLSQEKNTILLEQS